MGAAAAAVLLRRAIRRAFHAVRNLLVLFLFLVLMPQDQLQGRVLQQSRHSAVRVLLRLSMLRKHRCAIRQTPVPAGHPSRTSSTRTTSICIAHRSIAALHHVTTCTRPQTLSYFGTDVCNIPALSITGAARRVMKFRFFRALLAAGDVLCR